MIKKALVVVLGDLARSPRMQYHCTSLASNNYQVTVMSTGGGSGATEKEEAIEELETNQDIKKVLIKDVPDFKNYLPSVLAYAIKAIWQFLILIHHLFLMTTQQKFTPNVIIVQNPPSIPTLPILVLYCKIFRSKLIIDWHNYGYSILSLNLGPNHPIVRMSKSLEIMFGRLANAGFCVSEAMRIDLVANFQITYPVFVLYDKPPKHFRPLSLREKHNFFLKSKLDISEFKSPNDKYPDWMIGDPERSNTRFTITDVINKNVIMSRPKRPALIISSTSWTEDEDFGILLEALIRYDQTRTNQLLHEDSSIEEDISFKLPYLVCVITGKGPLKSYYEAKIKEHKFTHVDIVLPWLSAQDYPKMVASCDIGISLHKSSSGVDLPMKIVDMFGCGIPVIAFNYKTISELVVDDKYGQLFSDSDELFTSLAALLKDFDNDGGCIQSNVECSKISTYKKNIKRHYLLTRWEDNWKRVAKPVFDKLYTVSLI